MSRWWQAPVVLLLAAALAGCSGKGGFSGSIAQTPPADVQAPTVQEPPSREPAVQVPRTSLSDRLGPDLGMQISASHAWPMGRLVTGNQDYQPLPGGWLLAWNNGGGGGWGPFSLLLYDQESKIVWENEWTRPTMEVLQVSVSSGGDRVSVAWQDGQVQVYDTRDGSLIADFTIRMRDLLLQSVTLVDQGRYVAAHHVNHRNSYEYLDLYAVDEGGERVLFESGGSIHASPYHGWIVVAEGSGLRAVHPDGQKEQIEFRGLDNDVTLNSSADGAWIFAGYHRGGLYVFDRAARSLQEAHEFIRHHFVATGSTTYYVEGPDGWEVRQPWGRVGSLDLDPERHRIVRMLPGGELVVRSIDDGPLYDCVISSLGVVLGCSGDRSVHDGALLNDSGATTFWLYHGSSSSAHPVTAFQLDM